jgi:hypothetical protein
MILGLEEFPGPCVCLESTSLPVRMRTRFTSLGVRPEHVQGMRYRSDSVNKTEQ